jgi:hypothetical protein
MWKRITLIFENLSYIDEYGYSISNDLINFPENLIKRDPPLTEINKISILFSLLEVVLDWVARRQTIRRRMTRSVRP